MRNVTVGRVWGIPIRLNVSLFVFLPVLVWLIGSGDQIDLYAGILGAAFGTPLDVAALRAGATPWLVGAAAAVGLFVSVALHELGHSWAAMRYGLRVESITLWILGGLANLQEMPREWNRELVVAVAGPITSVLVAVVAAAGTVVTPASAPVVAFVLGWLAVTNFTLAGFNLLPAFPMDGGRVLRALLARTRPYPAATRTAARVGSLFALLFAVVGVVAFSPMLLLLALFVYGGATSESRLVAMDDLLSGLTVADVGTVPTEAVAADTTVSNLLSRAFDGGNAPRPVVDASGTVVGVVTLEAVLGVDPDRRTSATVADVATLDPPTVAATDDAFDALSVLTRRRAPVALVSADGEIAGVVTRTDFAAALRSRRAVRSDPSTGGATRRAPRSV